MRWIAPAVLALTLATLVALQSGDDPTAATKPRAAYTKVCDRTNSVKPFPTTSRDAHLGRAKLVSFRQEFENAEADEVYQPEPGVFSLKAALVFSGKRDLTIAVAREVRNVMKLDYGGPRDGYRSIRFRSCARGERVTGYPGGIEYTGPWPACVPVDVSVGDRAPQRYLLSFGAGRCKTRG